jgi:hypothetical protein
MPRMPREWPLPFRPLSGPSVSGRHPIRGRPGHQRASGPKWPGRPGPKWRAAVLTVARPAPGSITCGARLTATGATHWDESIRLYMDFQRFALYHAGTAATGWEGDTLLRTQGQGSNPSERAKVLVTGLRIPISFCPAYLARQLAGTWWVPTGSRIPRSVHLLNRRAQHEQHSR